MSDERRDEPRDAMAGGMQPSDALIEDLDVPESERDSVQGGAVMFESGVVVPLKETVTKISLSAIKR